MAGINIPPSSSSRILDEELDVLTFLCSRIAQMATRMRHDHLANLSFSPHCIESTRRSLLSMAERVEGSALLLESLLTIQHQSLMSIEQTRPRRIRYTRDELFEIRDLIPPLRSTEIQARLRELINYKSTAFRQIGKKSGRNVKTILMKQHSIHN